MPSDATGTQILTEDESGKRVFQFRPGPLFANIVLADEINRATPKTQSALLEAMEEKQVTVLGERHLLPHPFFVLATQNPVELEGTYPLPEAQLDRFMAKVLVPAPPSHILKEILARTTGATTPAVSTVFPEAESASLILKYRTLIRSVIVAEPLQDIIVRIISALTPGNQYQTKLVAKYLRFGPGPRGAQSLMLLAKAHALLDGRINLAFEDIRAVLLPTLRHRLIVNFQAEADGVSTDAILNEIKTAK
jgi:MoxR-like ATPase